VLQQRVHLPFETRVCEETEEALKNHSLGR
jgi:hypothetical protein